MIRPSRPGDEAALAKLWQIAFGDTMEDINRFFSRLYQPGDAIVWADGDKIASAIYLLDAGRSTLPDGRDFPTSYAYALATLPTDRGRGLGAEVTRAALAHSFASGFSLNVICPAEESLFPYYTRLGYTDVLPIIQGQTYRAEIQSDDFMNQVMSISFSAYFRLRLALLPPFSTGFTPAYLRYVAEMGEASGAGLFQLTLGGQTGLASVEWRDSSLFVREILPASLAGQGVQALMAHLGAASALFRTAPDSNCGSSPPPRPFALLTHAGHENLTADTLYFPFALD